MQDETNYAAGGDIDKPFDEQSPSEKLQDGVSVASAVPGAQNPESTEIKREMNFNTE